MGNRDKSNTATATGLKKPPVGSIPAHALEAWFLANRRVLPWRTQSMDSDDGSMLREAFAGHDPSPRRDPYSTWIAEIMLQQTQVATVTEYYTRWMRRFPDLRALAEADENEVLELWAGLGYYTRARNLLVTSRQILAEYDGAFPKTRDELLRLKGIGAYTAGAILSLAFGLPEPILDGNLVRVFSRFHALAFLPESKEQKEKYWSIAADWVHSGNPALVNEGLMELGAMICLPRNPRCQKCPLAAQCPAYSRGLTDSLPPAKRRRQSERINGLVVVVRSGAKVLLYKPGKGELWRGLCVFPWMQGERSDLEKWWNGRFPAWPGPIFEFGKETIAHGITHHALRLEVVRVSLPSREQKREMGESYRWADITNPKEFLVSSFTSKIWKIIEGENCANESGAKRGKSGATGQPIRPQAE